MSLPRLRSGGMAMVMTLNRKKRSSRNSSFLTSPSRSLFVAATMRTSTLRDRDDPTMQTSLSCKTRRSLTCMARLVSLTSSRKIVPPSAVWKNPARESTAPVNAPLTCPNNSLSRRPSGIPPQLTGTNGADLRSLL